MLEGASLRRIRSAPTLKVLFFTKARIFSRHYFWSFVATCVSALFHWLSLHFTNKPIIIAQPARGWGCILQQVIYTQYKQLK
jgi:hypothetical protein